MDKLFEGLGNGMFNGLNGFEHINSNDKDEILEEELLDELMESDIDDEEIDGDDNFFEDFDSLDDGDETFEGSKGISELEEFDLSEDDFVEDF